MPRLVHVVDDDAAIRDSLTLLLEASGLNVRAYASAVEFLEMAPTAAPGCVISDVRMPGMSGLDLLRELKVRRDDLPVILLTGEADVPMAVEALKDGALDFIEKPFDDDRIIASAERALAQLVERAGLDKDRRQIAERLSELTPRENEVLSHLMKGASTKEAARALGISPRTAEVYRGHIMSKTRAGSLAELVKMVLLVDGRAA
jgi:two-component system response regulator FixJ